MSAAESGEGCSQGSGSTPRLSRIPAEDQLFGDKYRCSEALMSFSRFQECENLLFVASQCDRSAAEDAIVETWRFALDKPRILFSRPSGRIGHAELALSRGTSFLDGLDRGYS